jgi:REP element-mobilizing transposase RayT
MDQSLAKISIHGIFSTKNREPFVDDAWADDLYHVLGGSANSLGCQLLIVNGHYDHVHLLFQLGRTITIADAIKTIKSNTNSWINQRGHLRMPFHWQSGYAAFRVSQSNLDEVRKYVRCQAVHHRHCTFQDELRLWLTRYQIEWDEKYLWDGVERSYQDQNHQQQSRGEAPGADKTVLSGPKLPMLSRQADHGPGLLDLTFPDNNSHAPQTRRWHCLRPR